MTPSLDDLQSLCALGQEQLVDMEYLSAERTLVEAERVASERGDFDTLSRLYLPLQETRRQRRLRCGEGVVRLDLVAHGADDVLDIEQIISKHPQGNCFCAGWGSIEPALRLRQLQAERALYVETFLAAAYSAGTGRAIVIVPLADVKLPDADSISSIDDLVRLAPAPSIILNDSELPRGARPGGDWRTFAEVCAFWERLHLPFLAAADMQADAVQKIKAYRRTIRVDYACELAHQKLSDAAKELARKHGSRSIHYKESP